MGEEDLIKNIWQILQKWSNEFMLVVMVIMIIFTAQSNYYNGQISVCNKFNYYMDQGECKTCQEFGGYLRDGDCYLNYFTDAREVLNGTILQFN